MHRQQRVLFTGRLQGRRDELTNLPNRRVLTERLDRVLLVGQPVGVVLLDLDHFKVINDSLGHTVGDDLLCEVANRLGWAATHNPAVRMVARLGGDEFVLVVHGDVDDTEAAGHAARQAISGTQISWRGYGLNARASAGCAHAGPGLSRRQLFHHADRAMYQSKRDGRVHTYTPHTGDPAAPDRPNPRLRDIRGG
jgi:diguanylate cyclase